MGTLLLRLAGPLQSWGVDSTTDIRRTGAMPSKSGVVGLLAAALGRPHGDSIEDLAALRFGVREDLPGDVLEDFHIAARAPHKTLLDGILARPQGAKGKPKRLDMTNVTRRSYIQDGVFLAGVESEDAALLERLDYAVRHPVFHLCLGRKACPPTLPISLGVRDLPLEDALRAEPWLVSEWRQERVLGRGQTSVAARLLMDRKAGADADGCGILPDQPVSFDPRNRAHTKRMVQMAYCRLHGAAAQKEEGANEHDPMSEL